MEGPSSIEDIDDELQQLRKYLGKSYTKVNRGNARSAQLLPPEELRARQLQAAVEDLPPADNLYQVVQGALEANNNLQTRLKQLRTSIRTAVDKNADLQYRVKAQVAFRQAGKAPIQVPLADTIAKRGSWFWTIPGAPPPAANTDVRGTATVASYLPLVFKRSPWTDEEKIKLVEGVLTQVQEQHLARLVQENIERNAAGSFVTMEELQTLQQPIKELKFNDPEVIEAAYSFTETDWEVIAYRSLAHRKGLDCKLQWLNSCRPNLSQEPWSAAEDDSLVQLVEKHGNRNWKQVSEDLGGHRAPIHCLQRHLQLVETDTEVDQLSDDDLKRLDELVKRHNYGNWKRVAFEFGGHWHHDRLMHIWRRCSQRNDASAVGPRKGKWNDDEDTVLLQAVSIKGRKWCEVARLVPGRTDVQCRERYMNVLNPEVNKTTFTAQEVAILQAAVLEHTEENGKIKWAKVAAALPGRTDSQCLKYWKKLNGGSRQKPPGPERKRVSLVAPTSTALGVVDNPPRPPGSSSGGGAAARRAQQQQQQEEEEDKPLEPTKSGRARKQPAWLKDNVTKIDNMYKLLK